jgi:hypothetical protein
VARNRQPSGICKLTGKRGIYVRAHLIPKALTRPATKGAPLIQGGYGSHPTRRWDSWYDTQLVIRAGEKILEDLDTWAIRELRKHHLIWSGRVPAAHVPSDHYLIPNTHWGVRPIEGINPHKLRLFFLSLLWRAAATDLMEFSDIVLPPDELETLRLMLLRGDTLPLSFYPAQLIQLSTAGIIHNHSPITGIKRIPAVGDEPERHIPIFRFYFDGLVVHMHRHASDGGYTESMGPLMVGGGEKLFISTVTYEAALQREIINHAIADAYGLSEQSSEIS